MTKVVEPIKQIYPPIFLYCYLKLSNPKIPSISSKSFISSRLARKTMTNAVCDLKKIMFDQINVHVDFIFIIV